MWRIAKVCPNCLGAEFEKTEDGCFTCVECNEEYDDVNDLENMDYAE